MKLFKHPEKGNVIKVTDPNTFSVYLREGFVEVGESEKKEGRKQGKKAENNQDNENSQENKEAQ